MATTPKNRIVQSVAPRSIFPEVSALVDATVSYNQGDLLFLDGSLIAPVTGDADGEFARPHDIEAAADGSIYVVDSGNHRVQVFSAAMKHRATFGSALKLNEPKYLHFDGEHVWLADEYNHRILLLDRRHRPLGMLGTGQRGRGPNAFYKPEAVLARAPFVWVIDTYNDRIVLLRVETP